MYRLTLFIMAHEPACAFSRHCTPVALPEQIPNCELPLTKKESRELATFDWSSLNTPVSDISPPKQKLESVVHQKCSQKLRLIEESFGLPSGLSHLIDDTKALMAQEWKTFVLYTEYDDHEPEDKKLWSNVQLGKWDLVKWFTMISCQYHAQIEQAGKVGVELDCTEIDDEFLGLLEVILGLEADENGVISIKEWERFGTKATLEVRELMSNDLINDEGNANADNNDDDGDLAEEETMSDWELHDTSIKYRSEPLNWEFGDAFLGILLSQAEATVRLPRDERRDLT